MKTQTTRIDWKALDAWDGREVTVGGSAHYRVTPQLSGRQVDKFKRLMGVCLTDGCHKIAGHDGQCS